MPIPRLRSLAVPLFAAIIALPLHTTQAEEEQLDPRTAAAMELTYYNFKKAQDLFWELLEQHGDTKDAAWVELAFGYATARQHLAPASSTTISDATDYFQQVIDVAPDSPFAHRAMLNLGRIAEMRNYLGDEIDLAAAEQWYRKTMDATTPDVQLHHEAALRIAGVYTQQYQDPAVVKRGIDGLKSHLEKHPGIGMAGAMWSHLGDTYTLVLGDKAAAADCYAMADQTTGLLLKEGIYFWEIATASEKGGNIERAVKYYTKIIVEAPKSGRAYESQIALKRIQEKHPEAVSEIPEINLFGAAAAKEETP